MDGKRETDRAEPKDARLDLSVAQVAGSAVAAVVAAVLASKLGVYGTIIGAGVVSVVATSGGTVFQHLFRRTGEQIREVTVHAKPKAAARQVTESRVPRTVTVPADLTDGEFGEATTHGTRVRGWKRSVIAAVVVFVVAMGGITAYELLSGGDLSGGRGSTVGNVFRGSGSGSGQHREKSPPAQTPPVETSDGGSATPRGTGTADEDSGTSSTGTGDTDASPDPGKTPPPTTDGGSTGEATPAPTPTPTPSGSTSSDTGAGADEAPATGDADATDSGAQGETPAP
ncbi:hypothetical protein ABZX62_30320 [Streptomyces flavidovirens]|uniref:Integral membrane protein n=1 Tax=Streptomyces flavidovirens TaxID=67298 RepID=A0ABW6RMT7_9ACTN